MNCSSLRIFFLPPAGASRQSNEPHAHQYAAHSYMQPMMVPVLLPYFPPPFPFPELGSHFGFQHAQVQYEPNFGFVRGNPYAHAQEEIYERDGLYHHAHVRNDDFRGGRELGQPRAPVHQNRPGPQDDADRVRSAKRARGNMNVY